jgi:D-glycero-D-manno-heptose 1,7-bisphosphate phosphatase
MVGDRWTDLAFADRCKLKGIFVKTGYGLGDLQYILPAKGLKPAFIAEDLFDAVQWIVEKERHITNRQAE